MASYNPLNQNQSTFVYSNVENKGLFSKILRNLSSFGMEYSDMVLRNTVGVGMNEDPYAQKSNSLYDFMSQRAVAAVLNKKSIPYLDRSYIDKRRILREYSIKDELRDFVSKVAEESIIYNDRDFCAPKQISNSYSQEIRDKYQEYFEKIYNRFGFADGVSGYNLMRDFLIDGYLALEIIWDDQKKNIINFNRLKPESIVPAYEPSIGNLWIQFPEDPQLRRIFLDSQIVFIAYSAQSDYSETSYLEGLIKPYNQLKVIEQSRIMFNIINATLYQKFVIPTKGLSRQRAEEQIGQLIADYSEEVEWDDTLGTITISGSKHLPYNKQFWFPEGEHGTPNMELMKPDGHDLNESQMLNWFYNVLKRASKIPYSRFDKDNGGGNIYMDASEMTRDEVSFGNFVGRLRSNFKEIIVKPLKLQMCMEFPELKDDEIFLNQCDITFNSNQLFETWKKLANMEKKANILSSLLSITKSDGNPYFHIEYLMDHVWEITQEEKDENERYWAISGGQGAAQSQSSDDMGGGTDFGGSPSGEFDSGMNFGEDTGADTSGDVGSGGEFGGNSDTEPGGTEFEF